MQHLIRIAQRGLAMRTRYRLGGHRLVGIAGQRSAAPFASHAALARPDAFGFLRLVRFLPLRRRQARIVRGLRWFVAPRFKHRYPCRQALHLRPQCPDQGILLGVTQAIEVRKRRHAPG